jgi:hypothetical protein
MHLAQNNASRIKAPCAASDLLKNLFSLSLSLLTSPLPILYIYSAYFGSALSFPLAFSLHTLSQQIMQLSLKDTDATSKKGDRNAAKVRVDDPQHCYVILPLSGESNSPRILS